MDYKEIEAEILNSKLPSKILLDRFRVIDEDSRKTPAYLDYKYAGFYYTLGKYLQPESVAEIGFSLGLLSSCFLSSCFSPKYFFGFKEQTEEFNSFRLGKQNIKLVFKNEATYYCGKLYDKELDSFLDKDFSLILYTEETTYDKHRESLEFFWEYTKESGLMVMDHLDKHKSTHDAFFDFCRYVNRQPTTIQTRYGVGIIEK